MPHPDPVRRAAAALVALGLAAGAAAAEPIVIEFTDGVVAPQELELPAGQATTLVLRNTGVTAAEFESKPMKQEQLIAPGAEVTLTLPALPAGSYEFVEEFHEDQPAARGVVIVK
ncbi:MAG: cupredoxin domain-containing protein [Defluviimonas sp.]|uniref:cupredoxin domain-containing protein n=1 Tax=Albidovulum sp. TaxID=1872424 RepID=UPI002A2B3E10|nr:cupredoxin domain-containing protein [Defluviimonas sp.]